MIEPMSKIEIVGLLDELDGTLDFLQHSGTVQIDEIPAIKETGDSTLHRIHLDESKKKMLEKYEELLSSVADILDIMKVGEIEETPLDEQAREKLKNLSSDEKQEMLTVIDSYRHRQTPLIVPITLLNHFVRKYQQPYLQQQVYLNPHPVELSLRNHA